MLGTMASNKLLAARLHDNDAEVRQLAADGLWAVWFRGDAEQQAKDLQRLMRQRDPKKALDAFEPLLRKAPNFAEAYNQRAILFFRLEDYVRSVADCEAALKLNPFHFGALAGMAQCFMKLRKPRAALKAFRNAFRINPNLEGVEDTIRTLEDVLGEEGRKEDK
jgi:tetratricopeptide (TPR) repeat protein